MKDIKFVGASYSELIDFPTDAKQNAGYQLYRLQTGQEPLDFKPLKNLGKGISGIYEIRVWADDGTFRVAYVTKLEGVITVLHCFQKKTQRTAGKDIDLIRERYREACREVKVSKRET